MSVGQLTNYAYFTTRERFEAQLQTFAQRVAEGIMKDGLKTFDKLLPDEIKSLSAGSLNDDIRLAKVVLQVIGSNVVDDYNHEAIKSQVKKCKRILKNRY